ncbi:MAG: fibronectin type III domain-containing protein [Candidatus Binatia bacterium]
MRPTSAARLTAPILRAQAIGPTQIRLTADTPPGERVLTIWAERTDPAGRTQRRFFNEGRGYESAHWAFTDGAAADTTYRYRAYADSGTTVPRNSAWSEEVVVRTLPAPTTTPAAPTDLTGRPAGPFRVELAWRDHSDNEYGFEVRKRVGDRWVRVVVVNPDTTSVTLHGRPPGAEAGYRVRAFNVNGASAESNEVAVQAAPLVDDPPVTPNNSMPRPTPEPCRSRDAVIRAEQASGDAEAEMAPGEAPLRIEELGGSHNLMALTHPTFCGTNCSWSIYGGNPGCFRLLGYAGGAGQALVATTPSGLPVLMDIGSGGSSYAGADLLQLVDGWFRRVDSYGHCSEDDGELVTLTPPFSSCQQDDDLWWRSADVSAEPAPAD